MKKIFLIIALTLSVASFQLSAGVIDRLEAQESVVEFITQMGLEDFSNPTVDGVLTINSSSDSSKPVLYVYNVFSNLSTRSRFVIVAGENRARRFLAYGDSALDMSDIPDGLQELIEIYSEQIERIIVSHPGEEVMLHSTRPNAGGNETSVEPLLTTMWDQNAPYNFWCPKNKDAYCLTGCVSTALSMIVRYHAFAQFVEPVPEYTTSGLGLYLEPLEPVEFDWGNMLDVYHEGEYTVDEANAVAQLMRYTGQAAQMDYTTVSSSAFVFNIPKVLKRLGYEAELLSRNSYEADAWEAILQNELREGRPVIYCANRGEPNSGHAFCIDGYDASLGMYHINWGWSGKGNCDCVLDAFSPSTNNAVYDCNQMMVVNIQPATPGITVDCEALSFNEYSGYTQTKTINVSAMNLTEDILLSVSNAVGAGFSVSPSRITPAEAANGKIVLVQFYPGHGGNSSAVLTLTSGDVEPVTIALSGDVVQTEGYIYDYQEVYNFTDTLSIDDNEFQPLRSLDIPFSWKAVQTSDFEIDLPYFPCDPMLDYSLYAVRPGFDTEILQPMQVFSYDLQGDSSYKGSMEFLRVTRDGVTQIPYVDYDLQIGGEFLVRVFYRFNTLGEHNATLTIRHPTLTMKPVVIQLNGTVVWPEDADYIFGDVNGDGTADVTDVTALIAYILGSSNAVNERAADVNGDQSIDVSDVTALISYILGE